MAGPNPEPAASSQAHRRLTVLSPQSHIRETFSQLDSQPKSGSILVRKHHINQQSADFIPKLSLETFEGGQAISILKPLELTDDTALPLAAVDYKNYKRINRIPAKK